MFGERVLGAAGAAVEAAKAQDGVGGGAIQFGPRVIGTDVLEPASLPVPPAVPKKPAAVAVAPKTAKTPTTVSRNRITPEAKAKPAADGVETVTAFTEIDVEELLRADPNLWKRVMDAEVARAFIRPAVAKMILDVSEMATEPAVPTVVVTQLARVASAAPETE